MGDFTSMRARERTMRRADKWSFNMMLVFLSVGVVGMLLGCRGPSPPERTTEVTAAGAPTLTKVQQRGKRLYEHYCALCHGVEGRGDGFNAYNLQPRPRDFTDAAFMQSLSDADLLGVVKGGGRSIGRSVLMPPWGNTLTDEQLEAIIAYIRTFATPSQQTATGGSVGHGE